MYFIFFKLCSCFISDVRVFFGVFLGPVLALVLFNMVVFVIVLRVLLRHCYRKVSDMRKAKRAQATFKTFISVVLISFMFGLQWIFGAFTIAEASVAFQWLFVIFSTLQGFFLFLYFCVFTEEAREEWFNLLSCGRRKGRKRATSTSQANRRDKSSCSTYSTSKGSQSNTLKRGVQSSTSISGETTLEMDPRSMKSILLAMPSPISECRESEIIENKAADDVLVNTSDEKVDMASDHSTDLEASRKVMPQFEVPEHVLERRRFTFHSNPAVTSPTLDNMNSKKNDKDDDEASLPSTTDCGELTQQTDLTILTNSDASSAEDVMGL